MGGVLAVKVAEQLEADGETVGNLILVDATNPENCPPFTKVADRETLTQYMFDVYAPRMGLIGWEDVGKVMIDDLEDGMPEDEDEDEEEVDIDLYLPRMREHISNSLSLIDTAGVQGLLNDQSGTGGLRCPVSLVKCAKLAPFPDSVTEERRKAIEYRFSDERNGWPFPQLEVVKLDTDHDRCFDKNVIPEITEILRNEVARSTY